MYFHAPCGVVLYIVVCNSMRIKTERNLYMRFCKAISELKIGKRIGCCNLLKDDEM